MADITEFLNRHACLVDGHTFVCVECGTAQPRARACFFCDAPGVTLLPLRHAVSAAMRYDEVCDSCSDRLRIDPNRGDWFLDECEHDWAPWQGPRQREGTGEAVWVSTCRHCHAHRVSEGKQAPGSAIS